MAFPKRPGASASRPGWSAELEAKPAYAEIRVIGVDDSQREIVRVDRRGPNGTIQIVPEGRLGPKGDRTYFKQTIKLRPGDIYVSPIMLDQIGPTIIMPPVPTLRVATPIFTPDGKPFGIFIINVDMRPAFDRVRSSARAGENVYLVDASGDYLIHPDRALEFGSMLGRPTGWQRDFPVLATSLGATESVARVVPDQRRTAGRHSARPRHPGRQ